MSEKAEKQIYSLHKYLDENGLPDFDRIFSVIESPLKRHIDPWLLGHLDNQPPIVQENKDIKIHLRDCEECRQKLESRQEKIQNSLPLNPE